MGKVSFFYNRICKKKPPLGSTLEHPVNYNTQKNPENLVNEIWIRGITLNFKTIHILIIWQELRVKVKVNNSIFCRPFKWQLNKGLFILACPLYIYFPAYPLNIYDLFVKVNYCHKPANNVNK